MFVWICSSLGFRVASASVVWLWQRLVALVAGVENVT